MIIKKGEKKLCHQIVIIYFFISKNSKLFWKNTEIIKKFIMSNSSIGNHEISVFLQTVNRLNIDVTTGSPK